MYKIKIYCNDGDGHQYWEDGIGKYDTYDKALIDCYKNALQETKSLMQNADRDRWFEVEEDFEITEAYINEELTDVTFFEIATIYYDHAPQDRENDCDIQIVTGYLIIECKEKIKFEPIKYKGLTIYKYKNSNWYAVVNECSWISGEDKVLYRCKSVEKCKQWIDKTRKENQNEN